MAILRLQGDKEKAAGIYYEVDTSTTPIGEGGMGKVYVGRCVSTITGEVRFVAIKSIYAHLPQQVIERARREAAIMLRNDNLIEMLGFIEINDNANNDIEGKCFVISELLHGVSLSNLMRGKTVDPYGNEIGYAKELYRQYLSERESFAKTIIKATLSGLMALHDAGYIHRDLDPTNIFITHDGRIKIIDFGIAKQMNALFDDNALTVSGSFMGKPEYASPELALGDLNFQNQTTDIYAVGIMLYQFLTGRLPFEGSRIEVLEKQVKEKLPTANIRNKKLRSIIEKATEKKNAMRYQTAAEMRVDIESLDIKRAETITKQRNNRRIVIAAAGCITIFIVGLIVYLFSSRNGAAHTEESEIVTPMVATEQTASVEKVSVEENGLAHVVDKTTQNDEATNNPSEDKKEKDIVAITKDKDIPEKKSTGVKTSSDDTKTVSNTSKQDDGLRTAIEEKTGSMPQSSSTSSSGITEEGKISLGTALTHLIFVYEHHPGGKYAINKDERNRFTDFDLKKERRIILDNLNSSLKKCTSQTKKNNIQALCNKIVEDDVFKNVEPNGYPRATTHKKVGEYIESLRKIISN